MVTVKITQAHINIMLIIILAGIPFFFGNINMIGLAVERNGSQNNHAEDRLEVDDFLQQFKNTESVVKSNNRDLFAFKSNAKKYIVQKRPRKTISQPIILEQKPVVPEINVEDVIKFNGTILRENGLFAFIEVDGKLAVLSEGDEINQEYVLLSINQTRVLIKSKYTDQVYVISITGI